LNSNKKVLGIFQLGPVQEFIEISRKTSDIGVSSFLLSYLIKEAMKYIESKGGTIIYPFSSIPGSARIAEPNVPNHFVTEFDDENIAKDSLKNAEEVIKKKFAEIQESIKNSILRDIDVTDGAIIDGLFQKQSENFWEIYWIISDEDPTKYDSSYAIAGDVFNGRKSIRNFKQISEDGYKCTLCGKRTPLHDGGNAWQRREKLRKFWEKLRSNQKYKYRFKENEQLCSICITKRLLDLYEEFSSSVKMPSTASIAISPWLNKLFNAYNKGRLSGDLLNSLIGKIKSIADISNESFEGAMLGKLNETLSTSNNEILKKVFAIEDSYYIIDTYQTTKAPENIVKGALEDLEKIYKEIGRPPKYYAVIRYDGDRIGEHLRSLKSVENHKQFSTKIYEFSKEVLNLESKHMAKVIYAGGDEGLIFSTLEDSSEIIEEIKNLFSSKIDEGVTISIGVTIAHYSQALQQVLKDARDILKNAKDSGRNATGVSILKRSGEPLTFIMHFDRSNIDPFVFFKKMLEFYRNDCISNGWWRDIVDKKFCFIDSSRGIGRNTIDREMLSLEAKRLLLRRYKKDKITPVQINDLAVALENFILHYLAVDSVGFDEFVNFMAIAEFIAREE